MRFMALIHQWSCHGVHVRTQGPLLMAASRTGFQLITSANLPRGRRRTRKHTSGLKAKTPDSGFFMHDTVLTGEEGERRPFFLEVFDK